MVKQTYTKTQQLWYYGRRFLRTVIPQLPAFFVYLSSANPSTAGILVALGGLATALDKYARKNWPWYPL